jgi:hypothetical protein
MSSKIQLTLLTKQLASNKTQSNVLVVARVGMEAEHVRLSDQYTEVFGKLASAADRGEESMYNDHMKLLMIPLKALQRTISANKSKIDNLEFTRVGIVTEIDRLTGRPLGSVTTRTYCDASTQTDTIL